MSATDLDFARAVIDSLRICLDGMIRLRKVRDTISKLHASLTEKSSLHGPFADMQTILVGSVGGFAASLELTITDQFFVAGQLSITGGLQKAGVEGLLSEAGELTLELTNRENEVISTGVPRLVGRFDGQSFSGRFGILFDTERGKHWRTVIGPFEFGPQEVFDASGKPTPGKDAPSSESPAERTTSAPSDISPTREQIQQVLSECRKQINAAYDSIGEAVMPLPFEDVDESTIQEDAARSLILEYFLLRASQYGPQAMSKIFDESSSATDEGLLKLVARLHKAGDGDVARVGRSFQRIAEILARSELGEHLRITDAEHEQLGHYVLNHFGVDPTVVDDAVKPYLAGWPIPTGKAAALLELTLIVVFSALIKKDQGEAGPAGSESVTVRDSQHVFQQGASRPTAPVGSQSESQKRIERPTVGNVDPQALEHFLSEQQEIVEALKDERRLNFKSLHFLVEHCGPQGEFFNVVVDPLDDKSSLDETLEGSVAKWSMPSKGHANILSVVPEDNLVTLRYASSHPPPHGEQISIQMPDFLGHLLDLWQDKDLATSCLTWLHAVQSVHEPQQPNVPTPEGFSWLRTRQREAFRLCGQTLSFLWGPPGTGKTTTLGCLLAKYLIQFPRDSVLLLSTTNTAVDQAIIAVDKAFDHLVRDGHEIGDARARCKRIGLHFIASHFRDREYLLPVADPDTIRELTRLEAIRPDPGGDLRAYGAWRDEIESLRSQLREAAREDLLRTSLHAMTTTRATFDFKLLRSIPYDLVVFDEASQVGLAHALMLSDLSPRVMFVGDPKQLAPVVQADSQDAETWLGRSMFDTEPMKSAETCILNEQDRMTEEICGVVSKVFYGGELKVAGDALRNQQWRAARRLAVLPEIGERSLHVRTIQQEGSCANRSWYRQQSMEYICQTVLMMLRGKTPPDQILVVTPFRAQRYKIRRRLRDLGRDPRFRDLGLGQVSVTTVHRAQGSERHTVLFDPVKGGGRWLMSKEGERLINVAISRAQARLVITLSRGDRENPILDYIALLA